MHVSRSPKLVDIHSLMIIFPSLVGKPGKARSINNTPKKSAATTATIMKLKKEAVREMSGIKKQLVQELHSDEETLGRADAFHAEGWQRNSGIA